MQVAYTKAPRPLIYKGLRGFIFSLKKIFADGLAFHRPALCYNYRIWSAAFTIKFIYGAIAVWEFHLAYLLAVGYNNNILSVLGCRTMFDIVRLLKL